MRREQRGIKEKVQNYTLGRFRRSNGATAAKNSIIILKKLTNYTLPPPLSGNKLLREATRGVKYLLKSKPERSRRSLQALTRGMYSL